MFKKLWQRFIYKWKFRHLTKLRRDFSSLRDWMDLPNIGKNGCLHKNRRIICERIPDDGTHEDCVTGRFDAVCKNCGQILYSSYGSTLDSLKESEDDNTDSVTDNY
jgi:hypothetical protein